MYDDNKRIDNESSCFMSLYKLYVYNPCGVPFVGLHRARYTLTHPPTLPQFPVLTHARLPTVTGFHFRLNGLHWKQEITVHLLLSPKIKTDLVRLFDRPHFTKVYLLLILLVLVKDTDNRRE